MRNHSRISGGSLAIASAVRRRVSAVLVGTALALGLALALALPSAGAHHAHSQSAHTQSALVSIYWHGRGFCWWYGGGESFGGCTY